jgi:Na+/H+ antiporter NhaC
VLAVTIFAEDGEEAEYVSNMYGTFWSLIPPVIAIALALITKEVYSSLFVGIIFGALFYSNFNPVMTATSLVNGLIGSVADSWNVGILIFLVVLGIIVALMNKTGGSAAYGVWASQRIKTRTAAQLATFGLGVLIFVDDYFNCLTVGSVMMPVTDKHKISRAKLAYLIDTTAAPVCIIAPISSWAAAVSGLVDDGFATFVNSIPWNFYALLSLVMVVTISVLKIDYGPMVKHEKLATEEGDLFGGGVNEYAGKAEEVPNAKGKVIDLILPVVILIALCVICMIYTGGFFEGTSFVDSFAGSDASLGLSMGSLLSLIVIFVYYMARRVLTFKEFAESLPDGFRQMVPAIFILVFAWTLSGFVRGSLGASVFVETNLAEAASSFAAFLPAIFFALACGIAFATGTSWGTFGILIPIALAVVSPDTPIGIISISACLGGAVMGDHCSPISDTTIMSSTGAQSNHVVHVATQIPYALTVAAVSFVSYIIAGFVQNVFICLPIAIILMVGTLLLIKTLKKKA